ncbi:MAG: hypothetical protein A3C22_02330 [Candidatus Levybacteria bacterium RIFCSPHIGHO2_02_FULL_37_10]|nr:MAG: hypothetical protein A3C22_02330 [Candidatus Levybacteria bacterium RIFCSPHIGHO2_02_FULL_37_10]OGH42369.1 MAG: hypothetical protein A3H79_00640 [Candidatus Levybacteria bacterium RIFCSPLOWO2_02_FULL_36_8b]
MKRIRNYKYKGITLIFISILLTIFLSKYNFLNDSLFNLKHIPILGSFIAGILYVSASTAALGILMLSDLTKTLPPLEIAIIAGIGGAVADFVLFRFFKGDLIKEITPIYNRLGGRHFTRLMYHKYFRWSLPIVGAIIIASPFPDELGISLMGLTKIKNYQFILLSLALDITGVFLLVSAFSLIQ